MDFQVLRFFPALSRIYITVLLTVYNVQLCIYGNSFRECFFRKPSYLADLIMPYHPSRNLRSSGTNLLSVPDIRSEIGRRSFSYAAPKLWNSLPPDLRSCTCISTFQGKLKTHLFPPQVCLYRLTCLGQWTCTVLDSLSLRFMFLQVCSGGLNCLQLHIPLGTSLTSPSGEEPDVKSLLID